METIVLFGADAKVGTTMAALETAALLAGRYPDRRIGLLHLDGRPGTSYSGGITGGNLGLDDLKAAILSRVLTSEELETACGVHKERRNLYELKGFCRHQNKKNFDPKDTIYLLEICPFDITILDCGSDFEGPLAMGALTAGKHNFLVTTQQTAAYQAYRAVYDQLLFVLGVRFEGLIVNKVIDAPDLPTAETLKRLYALDVAAFEIPYLDFGWQCEKERIALSTFKNKVYGSGVSELCGYAAALCGLPEIERKKRRLLSGLLKSEKKDG